MFFKIFTPPGGDTPQKVCGGHSKGPGGLSLPILVSIFPIIWEEENGNKQTDRHTFVLYTIYIYVYVYRDVQENLST